MSLIKGSLCILLVLSSAIAQQNLQLTDGQTLTVTVKCAVPPPAPVPAPYSSPNCGPNGASTPWACGAWPTTTAPTLGAAGTATTDADTGNRVLRVTQAGSFGEAATTSFKVFDGGWRAAFNANTTRILVFTWGSSTNHAWMLNFNAASMSVNTPVLLPYQLTDLEWDSVDPDLIVGLMGGVATSYNVVTKAFGTIFDPKTAGWTGSAWIAGWGGTRVCIASGPQDIGYKLVCYDRATQAVQLIDLHAQTINGVPFTTYFKGAPVTMPSGVGIHTITMALDGKNIAIDTHGNTLCSIGTLANYASTALFLNLDTATGYEWNTACGGTHWAYGRDGMLMQSVSPKWTATGASGPCNSDSRGIARRPTNLTIDSDYVLTQACKFFNSATWAPNIHLSWLNGGPAVLVSALSAVNDLMTSEIAAVETGAPAGAARLWRFARHWASPPSSGCSFLDYSSPSISRDGRWALYPSDWGGQTGSGGAGTRADVFLFELK